MTDKAMVSVVMPCYRCAGTIERAIASVAAQTLLPAEVVLVDDASGDDTRAVLSRLIQRYAPGWIRLVLLDQNVGAASARNAGWAVASQHLVAFLDADDAWHPRKIEVQYGYMMANPDVVLSGHDFRLMKQSGLPGWQLDDTSVRKVDKWPMILKNQFVTPSVMLRRDMEQRFIAHQRYMEDHMLWMSVVCSGAPVVKLSCALAAVYKNQFGVTGLSSRIWLMERGDLSNYHRLYQEGFISAVELSALLIYSLLKYVRRLMIYTVHLRWKK